MKLRKSKGIIIVCMLIFVMAPTKSYGFIDILLSYLHQTSEVISDVTVLSDTLGSLKIISEEQRRDIAKIKGYFDEINTGESFVDMIKSDIPLDSRQGLSSIENASRHFEKYLGEDHVKNILTPLDKSLQDLAKEERARNKEKEKNEAEKDKELGSVKDDRKKAGALDKTGKENLSLKFEGQSVEELIKINTTLKDNAGSLDILVDDILKKREKKALEKKEREAMISRFSIASSNTVLKSKFMQKVLR
jgi:hypothetical protein